VSTASGTPDFLTIGGTYFDFLDPWKSEFTIETIAHALARITRFTGHTLDERNIYSVAQHSVLVSRLVPPELAFVGLMHDSAEAFINDIARPLKHMPEMDGYRQIERRVEEAVLGRFGIAVPFRTQDRLIARFADTIDTHREIAPLGVLAPGRDSGSGASRAHLISRDACV